jgi:hypothetical protein
LECVVFGVRWLAIALVGGGLPPLSPAKEMNALGNPKRRQACALHIIAAPRVIPGPESFLGETLCRAKFQLWCRHLACRRVDGALGTREQISEKCRQDACTTIHNSSPRNLLRTALFFGVVTIVEPAKGSAVAVESEGVDITFGLEIIGPLELDVDGVAFG